MSLVHEFPKMSEGFLLDEDNALRQHLLGLKVYDAADHYRPVGVWFSHPDNEIREQRYPYMVISLIDITESAERTMAGDQEAWKIPLSWLQEGGLDLVVDHDPDGTPHVYNNAGRWSDIWRDPASVPMRFVGPSPIPVDIDYQIRAFSRHPRHSRQMIADLLGQKVPYRYGILDMYDIDGSYRRLQLLDVAHGESIEDQKRLFISVFTVRVGSYMPDGFIQAIEDEYVVKVVGSLSALTKRTGLVDGRPVDELIPLENTDWTLLADGGRWTDYWKPTYPKGYDPTLETY